MFHIHATTQFSAAHHLTGYDGNCSNIHGHNWLVKASLETEYLDEIGISIDFRTLKKSLNELVQEMDHAYLNNLSTFRNINPTSEEIARYLYKKLQLQFDSEQTRVVSVEVAENETSSVVYFE